MSLPVSSIVIPYGEESPSPCWFCTPRSQRGKVTPKYYKMAALHAVSLSSEVYEKMLHRGWARSGLYCYKPDLKKSCCPQYPLKLDALAFQPSKSQRKVLRRWNKHILFGAGSSPIESLRTKGSASEVFDIVKAIYVSEADHVRELTPAHRLEVSLELSSYTEEKYLLYREYLTQVHGEDTPSPRGFEGHLVATPFREVDSLAIDLQQPKLTPSQVEPIAYPSTPPVHLPKNYGTYHQLYRVDGSLVAMAVLDVLPSGVVSVYFLYDVLWRDYGLGKLSALREAALVKEMNAAGVEGMNYLYLGKPSRPLCYYEHKCQKMRYKGEYSPSFLADPETYRWHPLEECIPLLDRYRYACFSEKSLSIVGDPPQDREGSSPSPSSNSLQGLHTILDMEDTVPVLLQDAGEDFESESYREDLQAVVRGLGEELANSIFYVTPSQSAQYL